MTVQTVHSFLTRHNADRFSKLAFSLGQYQNETMDFLATNNRDFATLMALSASGQGRGAEAAQDKLKQELTGRSWTEYCAAIKS